MQVWIIPIALAVLGLLIIAVFTSSLVIRVAAIAIGVTACVVTGIIYYVFRRRRRDGK